YHLRLTEPRPGRGVALARKWERGIPQASHRRDQCADIAAVESTPGGWRREAWGGGLEVWSRAQPRNIFLTKPNRTYNSLTLTPTVRWITKNSFSNTSHSSSVSCGTSRAVII